MRNVIKFGDLQEEKNLENPEISDKNRKHVNSKQVFWTQLTIFTPLVDTWEQRKCHWMIGLRFIMNTDVN